MAVVLTAVWIAFAAGFVALAAGAGYALVHGLRAWRAFRRTSRTLERGLGDLTAKAAATEEKAVAATANSAKLAGAVASLQESLATFAVLRAAWAEATAGAGRLRGVLPRK